MAKNIVNASNFYVANWLAELKFGPCSFCTPSMWEMVRRQHPVFADPELQRLVQSSLSGSGNLSGAAHEGTIDFAWRKNYKPKVYVHLL